MNRLNASAVMTPTVVTVGDRMTTQEVAQFLVERETSGAPVVDELGRLVGVISITGIAAGRRRAGCGARQSIDERLLPGRRG